MPFEYVDRSALLRAVSAGEQARATLALLFSPPGDPMPKEDVLLAVTELLSKTELSGTFGRIGWSEFLASISEDARRAARAFSSVLSSRAGCPGAALRVAIVPLEDRPNEDFFRTFEWVALERAGQDPLTCLFLVDVVSETAVSLLRIGPGD